MTAEELARDLTVRALVGWLTERSARAPEVRGTTLTESE